MATKVLLSKDKKQFKANLHCHSTLSDGALTPEQLKEAYKAQGYSVLSITDHCVPCPHNDLTDDEFLMLTGYEAYIRPHPEGKYNQFKPEIHLNLFARDKDNDKFICYNAPYAKYNKGDHSKLNRVGSEEQREYTVEYINKFIATAKEHGYILSYNHPFWSMEDEERVFAYEGYFSLELDNTSSCTINCLEHAEMLYDKMLRRGIRVGCHSADDNHNKFDFSHPRCDSFGGHTMILADSLDYDSVFSALESCDCYASTGPRINEISVTDGQSVHVECSDAERIILFYGSKSSKVAVSLDGTPVNSADLELHPKAKYFRITVIDKDGNKACSRGFFRDEFED